MRKSFTLYCSDRESGRGEWEFQVRKDGINVIDPDGRDACWYPHDEANENFALPSFWRSIKHIVFTTDRGTVIRFDPDPEDVRIVRRYLDDALVAGGAAALKRLRNRAVLSLAGGLGLVLVCLAVVFLLDQVMRVQDDGRKRYARPFFVGAIVGISLTGWGLYALFRFARLLRRWKEEEYR